MCIASLKGNQLPIFSSNLSARRFQSRLTVTLGYVELYASITRQVPSTVLTDRTLGRKACAAKCLDVEIAIEARILLVAYKIALRPVRTKFQCMLQVLGHNPLFKHTQYGDTTYLRLASPHPVVTSRPFILVPAPTWQHSN